jgi:hypothetical protein
MKILLLQPVICICFVFHAFPNRRLIIERTQNTRKSRITRKVYQNHLMKILLLQPVICICFVFLAFPEWRLIIERTQNTRKSRNTRMVCQKYQLKILWRICESEYVSISTRSQCGDRLLIEYKIRRGLLRRMNINPFRVFRDFRVFRVQYHSLHKQNVADLIL